MAKATKESKPLTKKQKVIRIVALVLAIALSAGYIVYCVVTHNMVFGKEYYLAEVPMYPIPSFYVSDTGFLLDREWVNDEWNVIVRSSVMRRIHLNYFNYDILFAKLELPEAEKTAVGNFKRDNVAAWRCNYYDRAGETIGLCYLFLQKDGSVYSLPCSFPSDELSMGEEMYEIRFWNFKLLRSTDADYTE